MEVDDSDESSSYQMPEDYDDPSFFASVPLTPDSDKMRTGWLQAGNKPEALHAMSLNIDKPAAKKWQKIQGKKREFAKDIAAWKNRIFFAVDASSKKVQSAPLFSFEHFCNAATPEDWWCGRCGNVSTGRFCNQCGNRFDPIGNLSFDRMIEITQEGTDLDAYLSYNADRKSPDSSASRKRRASKTAEERPKKTLPKPVAAPTGRRSVSADDSSRGVVVVEKPKVKSSPGRGGSASRTPRAKGGSKQSEA